jgi:hypothetical protein
MSLSDRIRKSHRWLGMILTLTIICNFGAMALGEPPRLVVYSPLAPLVLLVFSGLYMFFLPYAERARSRPLK